ncbi:ThiF family adenylyltransferase [Nocardioides marmoriginsengisoli]|uniref:ThiF family adenylyltransferase n=1 Tax=Nocardioides marmoriginsengisoli TaxID=661483 RepID=A0A3N0CQ26_9ACTN|nr:ThiF family adenylyltransferase [Nocardioides marmoriginsengisoli]RNL65401.1 ThiF family adenylyltransferase [Nocardioides marmoriginsengisoli]
MTRRRLSPTPWQAKCLEQLKASAAQSGGILRVVGQPHQDADTGSLQVRFWLDTSEIPVIPGGLPLGEAEEFTLAVEETDERPPAVFVDHIRFLGHAHVLSGLVFCLYLDESREWEPGHCLDGPEGVLNRLWRFLTKAANREFDGKEALFHAVGGVPHLTRDANQLAPIVVRDLPQPRGSIASAWLVARSPWCFELRADRPTDRRGELEGEDAEPAYEHVPVFFPDHDLPFGAGTAYLPELTQRIGLGYPALPWRFHQPPVAGLRDLGEIATESNPRCRKPRCPFPRPQPLAQRRFRLGHDPSIAMLAVLAASAARKPPGTSQLLMIAVPHPHGGPRHLIAVYFDAPLCDRLRTVAEERRSAVVEFDQARLDRTTPLRWCYVSDERPEVTTRRDIGRPVSEYEGKNIFVWGVGGLGSWAAEFVTRAGAREVTVCDHGRVTGGLLVRQNYTDADIGAAKADRLVERLRAIAPEANIQRAHIPTDDELERLATEVDAIIDATVNPAVARRLDAVATRADRRCVVAQISTDVRTGSLGLAVVAGRTGSTPVTAIDRQTGVDVEAAPALEAYRVFWDEPGPGDEFVPTRGCSLPTFHGSAADLASVAGSLISLVASHLRDGASGTHLISLPHAGVTPSHHYRAA